ncbi:MAG: CPBP family intramembrane metalloprotease [Planctomycetota bacterium]|nr:CPBP family intramembrane metalloprotease [Planctomycetota bacterium]
MSSWPPSHVWQGQGMPLSPAYAPVPPYPPAPRPTPPPAPLSVYIAWFLIILATLTIILMGYFSQRKTQTKIAADEIQIEMVSRYSVGYKQLVSGITAMPAGAASQLVMSVKAQAQTPVNQIRAIPVIGELEGNEAAAKAAQDFLDTNPPASLHRDASLLLQLYRHGTTSLSIADQQLLVDRYEWFGRLAVAHDAPPTDPHRLAVYAQARKTLLGLIGMVGVGGAMLLTGLVVFVLLSVKFFLGTLPPKFTLAQPHVADLLVEGLAVWLCMFPVLQIFFALIGPPANFASNFLIVLPFVAALLWLRTRGLGWGQLGAAVGWERGRGIVREMFAGLTAYIAGLPLLVLATIVTVILTNYSHANASHPIVREIQTPGWTRVELFFLACVFAPITEEFLFRGLLLSHLRLRLSWFSSALIVSFIFAAIHPQGWTTIPVLGTIAMVLASVREQRGSLIAPITAHALNNFMALLIFVLLLG